MPNGITVIARSATRKSLRSSAFMAFGVDEDVVGEPVLDLEAEPVHARIAAVALGRVDVVRGQRDLPAAQPVVEHQRGAIEHLELVVPEDVEDRQPRGRA